MSDYNVQKYYELLINADYNKLKDLISEIETNIDKDHILEQHFYYMHKLECLYAFRDQEDNALDETIDACKQQIAIADNAVKAFQAEGFTPTHTGYKQLTVIYQKQNKFKEAIEVCEQALKQGWMGDWQKRIERYTKKL